MILDTNYLRSWKIALFSLVIMAFGFTSCSFPENNNEAIIINSTWSKTINELIDDSVFEEDQGIEDNKLEDLDKLFEDLDLEEIENENDNEQEWQKDDFWANISKIAYWGSSFWWKNVDVLYAVTWFIPNSSETMTYKWASYSKWVNPWDMMKEFAIIFNDISFDSISYKTNSLEYIGTSSNENNQAWIRFKLFFDKDSSDVRSSKLRQMFQRDSIFDVTFAYLVNKLNWPGIKISSSFKQLSNEGDSFVFKWECLESDWTWDSGNFRDNREIFSELRYSNSNSWYVLDKYWQCISWINWKCEAWANIAEWNDFFGWVLMWWKKYLEWDITSIRFPWSWALCSLYDDFDKTSTIPAFCWAQDKWLWSADTRWRVSFRPKKDSFCVVADSSIYKESNYPKVACNIIDEKTESFDYYDDNWTWKSDIAQLTCWDDDAIDWKPEYLWSWKPRDCIVEDFQCKWASSECWTDWKCWWWCGGWNMEVKLRKDVKCYYASWSWKNARLAARDRCNESYFTWALATWRPYCYHSNPDSVDCDTEPDPDFVLWCYCDVTSNSWKEPACIPPFVEWAGWWCNPWEIQYTTKDCAWGWQLRKQICSDSKVWISISWAKWVCANSCTSTDANMYHIVNNWEQPYDITLDMWQKIFFKAASQDSLDLCMLWNRTKKQCTPLDGKNLLSKYLWLATDTADLDKQSSYVAEICDIECMIYKWWASDPMDEIWPVADWTWVTQLLYSNYKTGFQKSCSDFEYGAWTLMCKTWLFYQWSNVRWKEMYRDCFDCATWVPIPATIANYWNPTSPLQSWTYDTNPANWSEACTWVCESWYSATWYALGQPTSCVKN